MWNPFSKTQRHYFRKQAELIGGNNAHFNESVRQHPRLIGSKAKLHAGNAHQPAATRLTQTTEKLNRHHAHKMLARYPKGELRHAAFVVLNRPDGKISKDYARAVRILAKEEARCAHNKSWKTRLGLQKPMTANQREAVCDVADEQIRLQAQREQQELSADHGQAISRACEARKTDHLSKLNGLNRAGRNRKEREALSEFSEELSEELKSLEKTTASVSSTLSKNDDGDDQLVVFVNLPNDDSSESESLV